MALLPTEPRLKIIELSRNFGHHKAMMTGLEHASGDLVFLIDVDLEEPPNCWEPSLAHFAMKNWMSSLAFKRRAREGGSKGSAGIWPGGW